MGEYRHGTHSVFGLHVHPVWCTKYRRPVLIGEIGYRFRDLVRQMCPDTGIEILKGVVAKELIHLLVLMALQLSVSKSVQKPKGKTSYMLQREYCSLQKVYWGRRM